MTNVEQVASVHPQTVTDFSEGNVTPFKHRNPPRGRSSRTWTVNVDPDVWKAALRRNPDPRCQQVISPVEVITWNHPAPWPTR